MEDEPKIVKTPAAMGGEARRDALSPEVRKEIAARAASFRWDKDLPRATHEGQLEVAGITFACFVLNDETRVLSEMGFMDGLGMYRSGALSTRREDVRSCARAPLYLAFKNLKPYVVKHLGDVHGDAAPFRFRTVTGKVAHGIRADFIPKICEVWIDAQAGGRLGSTQEKVAAKANLLLRGLARVGIVALVDEATGYQAARDRDALHRILKAYVSEALLPWTRRFPDEFFSQMFRLRGWQRNALGRGPRYAGKLVNQLVYDKLPPGVLAELRQKNPMDDRGQRKHKHHQYLTLDLGNTHLEKQVASVTTLMRASPSWEFFNGLFERAFPEPTELSAPAG